jgi:hypothetical protein
MAASLDNEWSLWDCPTGYLAIHQHVGGCIRKNLHPLALIASMVRRPDCWPLVCIPGNPQLYPGRQRLHPKVVEAYFGLYASVGVNTPRFPTTGRSTGPLNASKVHAFMLMLSFLSSFFINPDLLLRASRTRIWPLIGLTNNLSLVKFRHYTRARRSNATNRGQTVPEGISTCF